MARKFKGTISTDKVGGQVDVIDYRFSRWFQRVRISLRLNRHDVVDIMSRGGIAISSSRADGWTRPRDGRDDRTTVMGEDEFEAFTRGLVEWARDNLVRS